MCALPQSAVTSIAELRAIPLGQPRAAAPTLDGLAGVVRASRLGERPAPAVVSTGIADLDALTGGVPRGALTEICGPASSGRTSVLLSLLAQMTRGGEVCALVDASDSFDPLSAQAAGVELGRLLWARCSPSPVASRQASAPQQLTVTRKSEIRIQKSEMSQLEQALKATDLLLQGGGFGLVAVDLGDIPPSAARRVPLTSWFRFRRAVENTATVLLVIEQEPYAKTCASLVIGLQSSAVCWRSNQQSAVSNQPTHASILRALAVHAELVRDRAAIKKPVRSAQFHSRAQWAANL